jgi:cytochrome c-type biogenesis protein CcmH
MTLWLIFGLMTAAAIFAVIWPLARHGMAARSGCDIAVYRDQLDELERDLAAGFVGKTEAEAARVEISRRLLAAADAAQAIPPDSNATAAVWRRRSVALVALLLLPVGTGALYFRLGSPGLASGLVTAQHDTQPEQQTSVENLVAKAEAHLQKNSEDGRGWEVLAPVYMKLGRYSDSVIAWHNTIQLLGESADRQANLGEAMMAEANGVVTAKAKTAFTRAVTLDKTIVSARYYLGIASEQDGKREEAARIWRDLVAEAPPGAHWVSDVRSALARVEGKPGTPSPGPSPAQMAAAVKQAPAAPPEHDGDAIRGMVNRLAEKMKKSGSDPDGWIMLTRSYFTLGEKDKAAATINDARAALASDKAKLQFFNNALDRMKIDNAVSAAPAATPPPPAVADVRPPGGGGSQTNDMIRGMVARLADRLKQDGSDFDGWMRLVRSYLVLGERDKAASAATDARHAIGGDGDKRRRFDDYVKSLGLDG